MNVLQNVVERYGGDRAGLVPIDGEDSPSLLPYATLVGARRSGCSDLEALAGVYEWQDNPLLFLVDGELLQDGDAHLRRIRRRIALRGDAPYMGVAEAGRLTVYAVGLDDAPADRSRVPLEVAESVVLPYLASERPRAAAVHAKWMAGLILQLLQDALQALRATGLDEADAVSLAGRALFTRFLADRGLIPAALAAVEEVPALFDGPQRAERTCHWLDATFNGDFLPLGTGLPGSLPADAFRTLGYIMHRAAGGQLYLDWEQDWGHLDFGQIPVGVLSQAYEGYLREHEPARQRRQGGYYTPRPIAEVLVRGAFHALRREGVAHSARVLDPAAGAGVFLVTAFRQLVAERWLRSGIRPDTRALREILYGQLTGFDIDEAALRFAALGLYLIAIELDPEPEPVEKLRFPMNLRERVLWKTGDLDTPDGSGRIGSLGGAVGAEHVGRYDLVVGNPPWTGSGRIPGWSQVRENVTRIARLRLGAEASSPPLPNEVPDLPFLWRAMEWARPDGQIAMALHARLLFEQGDGMPAARSAIFSALDVTGIVNGGELRNTNVWPGITAPFCLLFGTNRLPGPGSGFRFLSPRIETSLNGAGTMRLDPANAEVVTARQVVQRPTILKTLFRGTRLDLELLERIEARELPTLGQYWGELFGRRRNHALQSGNGYQRLRDSSRVRKEGLDGLPGVSATYLHGLPELNIEAMDRLVVDTSELQSFERPRIHDPRDRSLFSAPLVIVRESPPAGIGRITAAVSYADVVFNQSFYGYSAVGHSQAKALVRYISLLLRSRFALWFVLARSGKLGFERETIEKATIDSTPVLPIEQLSRKDLTHIDTLFDSLVENDTDATWAEVDAWVASLYGLGERDLQVIADTLKYSLPFAANRTAATHRPGAADVGVFCRTLATELEPWGASSGWKVTASPAEGVSGDFPWEILRLSVGPPAAKAAGHQDPGDWREIARAADRIGAVEILQPGVSGRCLWIGRLRQARYWSPSQARLLAQRILWDHADSLFQGDPG